MSQGLFLANVIYLANNPETEYRIPRILGADLEMTDKFHLNYQINNTQDMVWYAEFC